MYQENPSWGKLFRHFSNFNMLLNVQHFKVVLLISKMLCVFLKYRVDIVLVIINQILFLLFFINFRAPFVVVLR